ncbi:hypothetical protein [Gordonia sp. (in: high G+C Gram-positive bacteria)]|uniref:hypothetical protein n=1 Tax=Gordonia sp. (in: high G+C Gram-positive bacteria) TaxID=84139 RepID=UPI00333EAC8D
MDQVTAFLTSPAFGAVIALLGVWLTNLHSRQIARENLKHQRNASLRTEVAEFIALETDTVNKCASLFDITYRYAGKFEPERINEIRAEFFSRRTAYIDQCQNVRTRAIRTNLFVGLSEMTDALDALRNIDWTAPITGAHRAIKGGTIVSGAEQVTDMFRKLEAATYLYLDQPLDSAQAPEKN